MNTHVEMSNIFDTDFWWLQEEHYDSLYVGVGHHKPLTDDDEPFRTTWFRSINHGGRLSEAQKNYPLSFIHQWRKAGGDVNVYRTLTLFNNKEEPVLLGPFLIDIDNSQLAKNGYKEDLEDALKVARATIQLLRGKPYAIEENDLRLFFTGRKGFNIEIRPFSLGIRTDANFEQQVKASACRLDEITKALQRCQGISNTYTQYDGFKLWGASNHVSNSGTTIDRIYGSKSNGYKLKHPYIRLHDSINSWMQKDGNKMARTKIRISLADLFDMSAKQICQKARLDASAPGLSEP